MTGIEIIPPIAQPTGQFRLLNWLIGNFESDDFNSFRCSVAFAKVKPLFKIHESLQKWNAAGKSTQVVFGIDHKGTSIQALQYSLQHFQHTYVLHADHSTFHPKLYIFSGEDHAAVYYGSSNLTSGGLETNFEGGIILNLDLPGDFPLLEQAANALESLLPPSFPCCVELTESLLQQISENDLLLDENLRKAPRSTGAAAAATGRPAAVPNAVFAPYRPKPPKAISRSALLAATMSAGIAGATPAPGGRRHAATVAASTVSGGPVAAITPAAIVDSLVMQVIPHYNGEILLSKMAINQNPDFFGFPFTGRTVPKKASNPTYPQRDPDPVVNVYVYDETGACVRSETRYHLNTVFYEKKAEIRITITPAFLSGLNYQGGPEYPLLVMSNSADEDCDYDLHFYAKGSTEYESYLSSCDQSLPSGGKAVPRKMGWL